MPMGAEITGRRAHIADRRWRQPDADEVPLKGRDAVREPGGSEGGEGDEDCTRPSRRAWESTLGGSLRLSPAERANPAFATEQGAGEADTYGDTGPRADAARTGIAPAGDGRAARTRSGTGRWVRTGGAAVRWYAEGSADAKPDDQRYWRWIATTVDYTGDAVPSGPEPVVCGAFGYLDNEDGTATLVSYEGQDSHVEVPPAVDGLTVSVLGAALFANHGEIESVALPDALRVVDDHAFDGCSSLAHIELPAGVERIGVLAFAKSGLSDIRIPASVGLIGEKAFFHCKHLARVELASGLRSIGEMAFAHSGLERVRVPASVTDLGFNAFDMTPAQKHAGDRAIEIDPANGRYRFDGAGLYCGDALVELVGYVAHYEVVLGTRRIQAGACKRHPALSHVHLPEGLVEIGDEAFCSNRRLVRVDLPESLERIGARAFADTSLSGLRIGPRVALIGSGALLVQGESQMKKRPCLGHVDLDPANLRFYIENGLLCERGASPDGGDVCLLYVGADNVVRIPDAVTMIAAMAFGSTDGVDELFVHDHVRSFCHGWLSTARTIPLVHVDFARPVDGYAHGDFLLPSLTSRFRYPTDLFSSSEGGTVFDFDYYDAWVTCTTDIEEFAPAAYGRLRHPMGMSAHTRGLYRGIFERKSARVCRYFAEHAQLDALEFLVDEGLVGLDDIESELDVAMRDGRGQATACLLEMRHRLQPGSAGGVDFSL